MPTAGAGAVRSTALASPERGFGASRALLSASSLSSYFLETAEGPTGSSKGHLWGFCGCLRSFKEGLFLFVYIFVRAVRRDLPSWGQCL